MTKNFLLGVYYFSLALFVMAQHVEDGNIFGIYILHNIVKDTYTFSVGDFWSSLFIIYLLYNSIQNLKRFVS